MPRPKIETVKLKITFSKGHDEMINELLATGKFLSTDDVIRQALVVFHAKIKPPYLRPTINQEIKMEKIKKEKEYEAIPDEEIANSIPGTYIYTDDDGKKFMFYRALGNDIGVVPLEKVKEWVNDKENTAYKYHLGIIEQRDFSPYTEEFQYNSTRRHLAEKGVAIHFDPKYTSGIYDEETKSVRG